MAVRMRGEGRIQNILGEGNQQYLVIGGIVYGFQVLSLNYWENNDNN